VPGTPQRKQAKPEGRFQDGKDYNTGYRNVFHEIDIPGRQSHEPHSIRAHARETSPNQWLIKVTHGPHEERDPSGSYYKDAGTLTHTGPMGSVKSLLKRTTGQQFRGLRK